MAVVHHEVHCRVDIFHCEGGARRLGRRSGSARFGVAVLNHDGRGFGGLEMGLQSGTGKRVEADVRARIGNETVQMSRS